MKGLILLALLTLLPLSAQAIECEVQNQLIVKARSGGVFSVHECVPGMMGDLTAREFHGRYLADFIEANSTDPRITQMLERVVPGMPLADVLAALRDGNVLISSMEDLLPFVEFYNNHYGYDELIAAERQRERDTNRVTPRSISDLTNIASANSQSLSDLFAACNGGGRPDIPDSMALRPLRINFEDGERSTIIPTGWRNLGGSRYELRFLSQVDDTEQTRVIEAYGTTIIWRGADGVAYPLASTGIEEITDDSAAAIRSFNSPDEDPSCFLERVLPSRSVIESRGDQPAVVPASE